MEKGERGEACGSLHLSRNSFQQWAEDGAEESLEQGEGGPSGSPSLPPRLAFSAPEVETEGAVAAGPQERKVSRSVGARVRRSASTTVEQADRLLTVPEASAMLGLKPATLYRWAYERRLPRVKLLGGALRFRLSTLLKLIAESEQPALREKGVDL